MFSRLGWPSPLAPGAAGCARRARYSRTGEAGARRHNRRFCADTYRSTPKPHGARVGDLSSLQAALSGAGRRTDGTGHPDGLVLAAAGDRVGNTALAPVGAAIVMVSCFSAAVACAGQNRDQLRRICVIPRHSTAAATARDALWMILIAPRPQIACYNAQAGRRAAGGGPVRQAWGGLRAISKAVFTQTGALVS
jgi:hypothetical protein